MTYRTNLCRPLGFPLWIVNRTRLFFGLTISGKSTTEQFPSAVSLISQAIDRIIFPEVGFIATILFLVGFLIFAYNAFKTKKDNRFTFILISLWIFVPLLGYGIHSAPGSAYFPLVFVPVCIMLGYSFYYFINKFKPVLLIFILLIVLNSIYFFQNSFFIINSEMRILPPRGTLSMGLSLKDQTNIALVIVKDAHGNKFQLKGAGFYGIFESSIDNYEYLVLYEGGKITNNAKTVYTLYIPTDRVNKSEVLIYKSRFIQISKKSVL